MAFEIIPYYLLGQVDAQGHATLLQHRVSVWKMSTEPTIATGLCIWTEQNPVQRRVSVDPTQSLRCGSRRFKVAARKEGQLGICY